MNEQTEAAQGSDFSEQMASLDRLIQSRHYETAIALAREMLEDYPDNAHLRTTLGDIYAARRMWPEAVEWYYDAVEHGDDSARPKLTEAHAQLTGEAAEAPPRARSASQTEQERTRLWITLASAGGVVVVAAVIASLILFSGPPPASSPPGDVAAPRSPGIPSSGATAARSSARPTTSRTAATGESGSAPASAPAVTSDSPPPQPATGPRGVSQPYPQPPEATQEPAPEASPRTQRDLALESAIGSLTWPDGTDMRNDVAVAMDPATAYAMITFEVPRGLQSANLFRTVVRQGYAVAAAAVNTDSGLDYVTLRAIIDPYESRRGRSAVVVYRGNTSRESLDYWLKQDRTPSEQQLWSDVFLDTWWNQDISREGYR
jgi:hypothetical protein